MPINFPDSPAENDSFTSGGKKWIFNGTVWTLITANSYTIPTGEVTAAKIASNAVTEAKINAGAVTQSKLASGLSGITVTTTANRSAVIPSPFNGQFIFLTDTSQLQRWDGSTWVVAITTVPTGAPASVTVSGSPTFSTVTLTFSAGADGGSAITNYEYALSTNGGTTYGSYTALSPADASSPITITGLAFGTAYLVKLKAVNALGAGSSESSAVSFSTAGLGVEYLVIAGGGGGSGGQNGVNYGAGGAGGVSKSGSVQLSPATYSIVVGGGGAPALLDASSGTLSSGLGISASAGNGASRGFAGASNADYAGASNGGGGYAAGGGAGAGGNGSSGNGGVGVTSSITGSSVGRGGGGAGGSDGTGTAVDGGGSGSGGGSGAANRGGGGGGGSASNSNGNGGSGIVIVRYLTTDATGMTITGGTATTSGSYTIRTFTASGSLVAS